MVNPFDKTFFKFLFGFVLILLVSFAVLYFVDYSDRSLLNDAHVLTAGHK